MSLLIPLSHLPILQYADGTLTELGVKTKILAIRVAEGKASDRRYLEVQGEGFDCGCYIESATVRVDLEGATIQYKIGDSYRNFRLEK